MSILIISTVHISKIGTESLYLSIVNLILLIKYSYWYSDLDIKIKETIFNVKNLTLILLWLGVDLVRDSN